MEANTAVIKLRCHDQNREYACERKKKKKLGDICKQSNRKSLFLQVRPSDVLYGKVYHI